MYQWQQNSRYAKGGRFCEYNFLKIMINSHSKNLDATFKGKGYFAANGT